MPLAEAVERCRQLDQEFVRRHSANKVSYSEAHSMTSAMREARDDIRKREAHALRAQEERDKRALERCARVGR